MTCGSKCQTRLLQDLYARLNFLCFFRIASGLAKDIRRTWRFFLSQPQFVWWWVGVLAFAAVDFFSEKTWHKMPEVQRQFGLQWWCAAVPWGIGWLGRNQLGGELWCAEWVLRFRNDWGGSRAMVLQNQEISLQKEMLTTDCHNIVIPLHSWHVRVLSFDFLKSHPEALAGGD